jgi:hypothetical protein
MTPGFEVDVIAANFFMVEAIFARLWLSVNRSLLPIFGGPLPGQHAVALAYGSAGETLAAKKRRQTEFEGKSCRRFVRLKSTGPRITTDARGSGYFIEL